MLLVHICVSQFSVLRRVAIYPISRRFAVSSISAINTIMKKYAVILSDAWAESFDYDVVLHPNIDADNYAFGVYLNSMLPYVRQYAHIYHVGEGKPLMDCIDVTPDKICNECVDIPNLYEHYYICGFHLGRCTHKKAFTMSQHSHFKDKISIIYNLSMLYPGDKPNRMLNNLEWYPLVNFSKNKGFVKGGVPSKHQL